MIFRLTQLAIIILFVGLGLAACSSDASKGKVAPIVHIIPEREAEIPTPKLVLLPVELDAPRDLTREVLIQSEECKKAAAAPATITAECKERPVDLTKSNLYRGFSRENYDNFRVNEVRKDEYVRTLLTLINQHNERVRKKNKEADEKMKALNVKPPE